MPRKFLTRLCFICLHVVNAAVVLTFVGFGLIWASLVSDFDFPPSWFIPEAEGIR